jgi:predicted phosphodiesterase
MPEEMGLLFIGDPHLASRPPGFRKDDYPSVALEKLRWALDYAREHRLRPVLLGDLFDFPRDNANWLLNRLFSLLDHPTLAVSGNHDCKENALDENDTLSVLISGGAIRLLDEINPWVGTLNGHRSLVSGTCWGQPLPKSFQPPGDAVGRVFWVTHHDVRFPGYDDAGRFDCREVPGIDVIVNGHIHRDLGQKQCGQTLWINPGNISRLARSPATRAHVPGILRADVLDSGAVQLTRVPLPHRPYDDVFHAEQPGEATENQESIFIRALAEFESLRTASGAGLRAFLDANLPNFEPKVAHEIKILAKEVLEDAR